MWFPILNACRNFISLKTAAGNPEGYAKNDSGSTCSDNIFFLRICFSRSSNLLQCKIPSAGIYCHGCINQTKFNSINSPPALPFLIY